MLFYISEWAQQNLPHFIVHGGATIGKTIYIFVLIFKKDILDGICRLVV